MKLSLGPAPFNWGKEKLGQFYREMADAPVDTIFIGEVFCEKRNTITIKELEEWVAVLQEKGKEVFFSTGALTTNGRQWERLRERCALFEGIEANTMGILHQAQGIKKIVAGSCLNLYNDRSIQFLEQFTLAGIVLPFELSSRSLGTIISRIKTPVEVIVYGNLPLGISWRCYVARALGRGVTHCNYVCMSHPHGIKAESVEGMPLFLINGPSVLTAKKICLLKELTLLKAMGVSTIRIMPQYDHTREILEIFRSALEHTLDVHEAFEQLSSWAGAPFVNGWFHGEAGWKYSGGEHTLAENS